MHRCNAAGVDNMVDEDFKPRLGDVLRGLGHLPEDFDDPAQWFNTHPQSLAVLAIPARSARNIRALNSIHPDSIIIAAGSSGSAPDIFRAYLKAGATGCITSGLSVPELATALAATRTGLAVIPTDVIGALLDRLEEPPPHLQLHERDRQILHLIAQGSTLTEIAKTTEYSDRHLRRITANLLTRIGATNRAHAAALTTRWGLK